MKVSELRSMRSSDPISLIERLDHFLIGDPSDYLRILEAASAAESLSRLTEAETLFKRSFNTRPDNSHAAYRLADFYFRQKDAVKGTFIAASFLKEFGYHADCFDLLALNEQFDSINLDIARKVLSDNFVSEKISLQTITAIGCTLMREGLQSVCIDFLKAKIPIKQHFSRIFFSILVRTSHIKLNRVEYGTSPKRSLMQYWDSITPPNDVADLLDSTRQSYGCGYVKLSHNDFLRMASRHFGTSAPRIVDMCEHPAAQADLTRLLWLYYEGGLYLDADMVVGNKNALNLSFDQHLFVVANEMYFPCISNWLIGSTPQSNFIADCLETIAHELSPDNMNLLTIFDITGPGMMTHVFVQSMWPTVLDTYALLATTDLRMTLSYKNNLKYKKDPAKNWILKTDGKTFIPGIESIGPIGQFG